MTQPANKRLLTEDQAAALSIALPVAPSLTASAGAAASVSRDDHAHPSAGLFGWYGDASDGDVVLDGTNTFTWAAKSGSVYTLTRPVFTRDMVVGSGVTVRPAGNIICVKGTLSGSGAITADVGRNSSSRWAILGPGAVGVAGGTGAGTAGVIYSDQLHYNGNTQGGSGAGGAGASGAGGAGAFANSTYAGQLIYQFKSTPSAFTGHVFILDWFQTSLGGMSTNSLAAGGIAGGAGGGDGTNSGGKGGDGGQVVIVNARFITGSVTISAPGGAGANSTAGNTGGGGGGTGGVAVLNTTDTTGWTGTVTAPGGAGGTKTGTGVAGSAGSTGLALTNVWA